MNCLKFKNEITDKIGGTAGKLLSEAVNAETVGKVKEIRLRTEKPLSVVIDDESYFLTANGLSLKHTDRALRMTANEMRDLFLRICRNSIYAYTEDIRNGFVTLSGGHRVGICGRVQSDGMIRDITALNIRVSKEIIGCSKKVLPFIVKSEREIRSTLIISPPCCGKTTLVRDIARYLSNGGQSPVRFRGANVGIIDERSEICSCENGVPSNDVGVRTDVLDGCVKEKGIYMMIRSMAPSVIVTDEIGGPGDYAAVASAINSGIKVISTTHGSSLEEVRARKEIGNMIDDNFFERFIVLDCSDGPGSVRQIV
ncbi:MAG: stage III sporulation protein AA [Ruminococcaceae bacterium]|nr:stage III sporulation protein AA [Oscillospiraceae bacterium]